MKRKICVVTGTRAEYGLLYWLMKEIQSDDELQLQIIATGMHLSPEFGLTYKEIEKNFNIDKKIEMLLSSDTPVGISKSMGLAQISFAEAYEVLQPDIVVVLGDRFEIFSASSAAAVSRIPIAHIHGGETTEGALDEFFRHSITKMSHLHFTSTEEYKKRVIQLGETPETVFNFGAPGIDNISKLSLLNKNQIEERLNFQFAEKNLLVTFHPVTLEKETAGIQFSELLKTLTSLKNTNIIFTKANADTDGRIINTMIDEHVIENSETSVAFTSMGQLNYLSSMQYVDAVVGNSSSGIIEAPAFKIATVNIGDRQKGRVKAASVIDCSPETHDIQRAVDKVYEPDFQMSLKNVTHPYGDGNSSEKIKDTLKTYPLDSILKKKFYDIIMTNEKS